MRGNSKVTIPKDASTGIIHDTSTASMPNSNGIVRIKVPTNAQSIRDAFK